MPIDWNSIGDSLLNDLTDAVQRDVAGDVACQERLKLIADTIVFYLQREKDATTPAEKELAAKDLKYLRSHYKLVRSTYNLKHEQGWIDTALKIAGYVLNAVI